MDHHHHHHHASSSASNVIQRVVTVAVLLILIMNVSVTTVMADTSPILIGVSIDVFGRVTHESVEVLNGYRIWERWTNENGGMMYQGQRRQVQLIVMDDQGTPPTIPPLPIHLFVILLSSPNIIDLGMLR
jgi:ABC-type branched-subunit amino acid transport system substrate-binding protein